MENAAEQNAVRNRSYYRCVKELAGLLERGNSGAVMLKGALLCALYPEGCRTSNDIDLLAAPEEVTALGGLLTENGFRQGTLRGGAFVPASREEIIASKMLRGETGTVFSGGRPARTALAGGGCQFFARLHVRRARRPAETSGFKNDG